MEKIRQQILQTIQRSENILLMPSSPVDGDSLGSSLALYLVFKKLGKRVTVVCADPVPDSFAFLPTTNVISNEFAATNDFIVTLDCAKAKLNTIHTKLEEDKVNIIITAKKGQFTTQDVSFRHGPSRYDLIITVDTGDLEQLGKFYEDNPEIFTSIPLINIDHHASNSHFGKINYVDMVSSSTTELLIPLIEEMEKESGKQLMDDDVATLLLAGIITDTGSFQNANTNPRSFAAAAYLIKHGARQQEIIKHVFKTKKLSMLRLWGRILTKINIDKKYRMAWSTITQKDLDETGSREDETGGIIDELMTNAPGVDVVFIVKQKGENTVSGSIRTPNPAVDASVIAEHFGGGGHTQAAGFKVQGDIETVEEQMVAKVREMQAKRLNLENENDEAAEEEPPTPSQSTSTQSQSQPLSQSMEQKEEVTEDTVTLEEEETKKETSSSKKKTAAKATAKKEKPKTAKNEDKKSKEEEVEVEGSTPLEKQNDDDAFTDTIVKQAGEEEVAMEPGITYRFED